MGIRRRRLDVLYLDFRDPLHEFRPAAVPTMTKTTRQLFLQRGADQKLKVFKGDVSGPFLQGNHFETEAHVIPPPELSSTRRSP